MNKLTKRMFALCVAVVFSAANSDVFATYVSNDGQIPESGLMFYDDFENFDESKYSSKYNSSVMQLDENNKVLSLKPLLKDQSASAGCYINLNSLGYDKDYTTCIRTGQLLISQDVYVPSHTPDGEMIEYDDSKSTYSQYLMNYALTKDAKPGTYSTASWAKSGAVLFSVNYSNNSPWIAFNKNTANVIASKETGYVAEIEPDTWHSVECCIDYDNLKISYYCDGEYLGDYAGADSANVIPELYGLFQLQISSAGTFDGESEHPEIYFDNYSIKMLKSDSFSIDFEEYGDNYIDLKCNYSIDKDYLERLNASAVKLFAEGDSFVSTGYELISNDKIRFYFDKKIISNGIYNVVIGSKNDRSTYIRAIYGDTYGGVSPGYEISFIPQEPVTEEKVDLINIDFDNESDFAAEDNSSDFTKYTYVRNRKSEDYDFVEDSDNTYKYCYSDDDQNGGKLLNLDLSDIDGAVEDPDGIKRSMKAVRFPFADNRELSGGTVYIDFDAGIYANANGGSKQTTRLLFGLENALDRETAHVFKNPDDLTKERWSNSSCLFGLSYWTASAHSLTYPNEKYRTRTCDWQRENNGAKTENQIKLVNDGEMHHYSVKIDISNRRYEFSIDSSSQTSVGYLPGGESDVRYNAFVMTLSDPLCTAAAMAKLDNLNVKISGAKTPNIEDVKFYDIENNEMKYSNSMSAKLSKIRLVFNQEVVDEKSNVIIDGLGDEDYSVSYAMSGGETENRNVLDVVLKNCLNADTEYTFRLSSETVMIESGGTFGREFTFSFLRGEGAGLNYIEPSFDERTNTVTANVMNFTDKNVTGYVTVAGYITENGVASLCGIRCNAFDAAENEVSNIISEENSVITSLINAGADKIGVFVFDGENTLKLNTYNVFEIKHNG